MTQVSLSDFQWTKASGDRLAILRKYEPLQPYLLFELAKEAGAEVFLDIGANIGAYSVLLSSLPKIRQVYAFEPAPETIGELMMNCRQTANSSKIICYRTALSDKKGEISFGLVSGLSGANSIVDTSIHEENKFTKRVTVETERLDSKVMLAEKIVVAKIDVEGHELTMLGGALDTLAKNRCLVQIEDYQNAGIQKFFTERNYRWLFNVGPDQYFTNMGELTDAMVVRAFSTASSTMISDSFHEADKATQPIHISLPLGVGIMVSGQNANRLRSLKKRVKS